MDDGPVDFEGVVEVVAEGEVAAEKLVETDSDGPDVDTRVVAFHGQHLGGDVIRGAYDGRGPGHAVQVVHLGRPHVHHVQVAVHIHDQVLRLDIPVHQVHGVEVLYGQDQLGYVEGALLLTQDVHKE